MSEQENTNLVKRVYENFKSGEIKALLNLLSDDIEWQLPEIENVPFAGKRRGQEEMGQFFASLVDTQEVQHFDPRELSSIQQSRLSRQHAMESAYHYQPDQHLLRYLTVP